MACTLFLSLRNVRLLHLPTIDREAPPAGDQVLELSC